MLLNKGCACLEKLIHSESSFLRNKQKINQIDIPKLIFVRGITKPSYACLLFNTGINLKALKHLKPKKKKDKREQS